MFLYVYSTMFSSIWYLLVFVIIKTKATPCYLFIEINFKKQFATRINVNNEKFP